MAGSFTQELSAAAREFDFFEAVRWLECLYREAPRVGTSQQPRQDPLRFGQDPSMAFAPTAIERFSPGEEGKPAELRILFAGLLGPNGAMPLHLTEFARERLHVHHDATMVAFLDMFHHRALSLFYRAWAAARRTVDLDRPEASRHAVYVGNSFGLALEALRSRDSIPDWTKFFFAGRLSAQNKNAEGLQAILAEDFGVPVEIQDFQGKWITLPADARTTLGPTSGGGVLGQNVIAGGSFYLGQSKFRVRFGPLSLTQLRALLPIGKPFRRLQDWVLNYCGREFFWDVQLVLLAAEVPATQLGSGSYLGWTSWLKTKPFTHHAEDLVLVGDN
ncbi:MAG: type VI secretion system baseplate subunit TssG [Verrucomicrobia bacterium]|nr:type VI secretion system baseplate subunit TssG [Verrucomicrobiota bacterium]